ncbi:thiamine pyrophosphate-binding protein, partial [Chloroflexota bacterium]
MSYRGGEILIQLFQNLEVEYIFCSPGTEWTALWEGLSERYGRGENSIKYINCRHEMLAVSAAIGYSKATGKVAAVLLHANLGPLNGAMAIRAAQWAQAPIIICSAYTTGYDEDKGRLTTESHWLSRLSDIGGPSNLVKPYVKWSNSVTSKETMVDSIVRGCQIAQALPQGPVFIAIPRELLVGTVEDLSIPTSYAVPSPPGPQLDSIAEAAKLLVDAERPIIITEYAGENPKIVDKMTKLAEMLSIPVYEYTSPMYANFPKSHPLHQGYDASGALNEADIILSIGAVTPWYPPSLFPQGSTRVIAIDADPLNPRLPYHN